MKKTSLFLGIAMLLLSSNACKETPYKGKGNLLLNFKAMFNSETVVFYTSKHKMPAGDSLVMHGLEFFLSDIKLVNTKGDTVAIEDVVSIDFAKHHTSPQTAAQGETVSIPDIPAGEYTELLFGIGVSPSLQATEPGKYPTSSPLGESSNYCQVGGGYIFSRIEGRWFPIGSANEVSFLFHSGGSNDMYRPVKFATPIVIDQNTNSEVVFRLNVKELFQPIGGTAFPVAIDNVSHLTLDYNIAMTMISNLSQAIHLSNQ